MSIFTKILILYLVVINVVTFFVYGIDKRRAKRSRWRIPEASLLLLAVVGGSVGAYLGMRVWHHKTLHKKFKYGVPLILIAQLVLVFLASCSSKKAVPECSEPVRAVIPASQEHSSTVFLVTYDAEVGKGPLLEAVGEYGCKVIYDYRSFNGMAIRKPDDKGLEETMRHFRTVKGVLSVNYDRVYRLTDPVKPKLEMR